MFQSNIKNLPGCSNYYGAVNIYKRAKEPRSRNWPEGTRPLDDTRKTHYAVIKDGDKIVFRLHRTNVVEWHNENKFTLDSSYDSLMTRMFAENFLPSGFRFVSMKEEGNVLLYSDNRICRGVHTFENKENVGWICVSPAHKPKRTVLQRSKMKEIQAATKDVREWVKGIWAIAGNDGSHPWVGKLVERITRPRQHFDLEELQDPERREAFIMSLLPESRRWHNPGFSVTYATFDAKQLCTKINEYFYKQLDAYIKIDYDAPIPRN